MKTSILSLAFAKALVVAAFSVLFTIQASAQGENVHSGNASLKLNNARANYHTFTNLTQGTTYVVSYWVKGLDEGTRIGVTLADDVAGVYPVQITNQNPWVTSGGYQTYTTTDNQWHQYFATITPQATSDLLTIGIDVRPSPCYIDDVVIRQVGFQPNLVVDPGFETAYQADWAGGPALGWPTAQWIDNRWYSEYAWDTYTGTPEGPQALNIEGTPTNDVQYAPAPDESWPPTPVNFAARDVLFANRVAVNFGVTGVQAASATNTTNYSVNNGNSVVGASIDSAMTTVTLTLANNINNSLTHTLTISGVLGTDGTGIATNAPGNNTVLNIAVPENDDTRGQDSGADKLLVLEAEHYNANSASLTHSWVFTTTPPTLSPTDTDITYSGTGVMIADPNDGINIGSPVLGTTPINTPVLSYKVNFVEAGTFSVWLRGIGDSAPGASINDSIMIGLDGKLTTRYTGYTGGAGYFWGNTVVGDSPTTITVPSAGLHVINVWMREDGFAFDKLLLSSNPSFNPTGVGPAESLVVTPQPTLTVTRDGANLVLTWSGGGILQSCSTNVSGTYVDIIGSSSPWPVAPTGSQNFYRVKQ